MNIVIEYFFINPEINEVENVLNNTLKNYFKKYGISYWKSLDYKYNIRFFDKIKNKTKNITTRHGHKRNIVASNGRYVYIEINTFIILIEGNILKNVISTYMQCGNIPMLWRKFFLNNMNNRDYINNYCNRPFKTILIDIVENSI